MYPKFTMEQHYMLPVLYCQYHAYWSRQGISRHGIDQISQNIPSLASEELTHCDWVALYGIWKLVVIGLGNGLSPVCMYANFHSRKCISKCCLQNNSHFVHALICYFIFQETRLTEMIVLFTILKWLGILWCLPHVSDGNSGHLTLYVLKFFIGNINIYLHFMSLLHINMTHVLKILPQVRPGPTYST